MEGGRIQGVHLDMNLTSFVPGLEFQFTFALGFAICSTRVRFFDLIHQKNSAQQVQTHLELRKSGKVTQVTKLTQLTRIKFPPLHTCCPHPRGSTAAPEP